MTPVDVCSTYNCYSYLTGIKAIDAGRDHICALTSGGGVKCWGGGAYGKQGDNNLNNNNQPTDVFGLTSGVTAITAGGDHTCALTSGGGVKCWGYNYFGEIGDNSTTNRLTPVDVVGLSSGVISISAGFYHTCALTCNGGVKCWGRNTEGQIGDNSTTHRLTPVDVVGLTSGVMSITTNGNHSCAFLFNGDAKCWGYNSRGQIGDNSTTNRLTPVSVCADASCVSVLSGIEQIDAGGQHTCALTSDELIKCWGYNTYGQIGDNSTADRWAPVDVLW